MRYLLDTNACIELIRGNKALVTAISSHSPQDFAVSAITTYELYTGVEKSSSLSREQDKVTLFCETFTQLDFDIPASWAAAKIRADLERAGQMIGPYDVLIAAHARSLALILITANTKEFQRVSGLKIENWQ